MAWLYFDFFTFDVNTTNYLTIHSLVRFTAFLAKCITSTLSCMHTEHRTLARHRCTVLLRLLSSGSAVRMRMAPCQVRHGILKQSARVVSVQSQRSFSHGVRQEEIQVKSCVLAMLDQEQQLLQTLTDDIYRFRCPLVQASIGQHVRHSLDHIRKPLEHLETLTNIRVKQPTPIQYDLRARNTLVETDRSVALQEVQRLHAKASKLTPEDVTQPMVAAFMLSSQGDQFAFKSSLAREMAFAVHHCIHHNAMIQVLLRHNFAHVQLPKEFGLAPSTARFRLDEQEKMAA